MHKADKAYIIVLFAELFIGIEKDDLIIYLEYRIHFIELSKHAAAAFLVIRVLCLVHHKYHVAAGNLEKHG